MTFQRKGDKGKFPQASSGRKGETERGRKEWKEGEGRERDRIGEQAGIVYRGMESRMGGFGLYCNTGS